MSDEILRALGELKAGQDALQVEVLQAVGQSNEAVMEAVQALSTDIRRLGARVDQVDRNLTAYMAGSTDNFSRVMDTLQAIHKKVFGDDSTPSRFASSR